MICPRPNTAAFVGAVPCGKCNNCRVNAKRKWVARILLEGHMTGPASFLTFTYNEDSLTRDSQERGILVPRDLQLFWKRFRKAGFKVRYFAVGEYGSRTARPHYHAICFHTDPYTDGLQDNLNAIWGLGFVDLQVARVQQARYIANYTVKKWTHEKNFQLDGRPPEFSRASRNPAIGVSGIPYLTKLHHSHSGANAIALTGDCMRTFRLHNHVHPLDALMLKHLRAALDIPALARDRPPTEPRRQPTPEELKHGSRQETLIHHKQKHWGSL